ncbi:hypothetical protein H6F75_12925 [Nodosilinea sp. FACHB-131]|nr:hypothetical protein [Nodosilinea sp. FACHB-131]MBD1874389.1 hypothetical protein [Nodosilinea sp. FACHB-131]
MQEVAWSFAAGALGGLANSVTVWLFGLLGITALLGVAIAPEWTPAWLYHRIVWGGLWGLLLPFFARSRGSRLTQGLLIGLLPAIAQLFIVFPIQTPHGVLGLGLGGLTPAFVVLFNVVWGVVAVAFYRLLTDADARQLRG